MSKILLQSTRRMQWVLIPLLLLVLTRQAWGQCANASQYPSTSIDLMATNASGATTNITTCNFSGEYSELINAVAGNSYRFTSSIATDYFTIRSGSQGGPVLGSGTQPLIVTPGMSGTLYAHINSSAACLSDISCRQTTVQCTSCAGGSCINSTVYPSLNISLNPTNASGTVQQITTCQFGGEYYSVIDVIAGKSYTFSNSVGTNWITVREGTFNGTILGQGAGVVVVTPSTTANLFIHTNTNASCGTNSTCSASSVQCTNCLCQNSTQFPSTAVSLNPTNTSGALQTVTSCNFATEYFVLTNVLSPKNYTITSSVGTDWLTVRVGSPGGPVLAQGQTPLAITTTSTSDLYVHVNTDSSCGTSTACRITTVQCTNCATAPACVASPTSPTNGQTYDCPTATQTLSWPASPGATSYDVYFGTTNPPPFVGNTTATSYVATTPGAGAFFWQIRPVGIGGTASDCNVWSFTHQDNTPPTVVCSNGMVNFNGEVSIALNANALVSASDNCGVQSILLSPNSINSEQVGQIIPVTVTVTDVNNNVSTCTANVTVTGLPAGWSQQPGGVNCAGGNNIAYNPANGVWTATSTNCYYASPYTTDATSFAQRTLCGNGSITALVTSISGSALGWAGVVMRESNDPGAKKAQLMTNLGNFSRREFRTATNGSAIPQQFPSQNRYWLRIVRTGNQFSMYVSPNGTTWYFAGVQNIVMNNCIQMGLVATNYTSNSTVTATFSGVSFTGSTAPIAGSIEQRAESIEQPYSFEVYPNPTGGELNVDLTQYFGRAVRLEVYSLEGKLLQFTELGEVQTTLERLNLTGLQNGMYLVKVKCITRDGISRELPDATKRIVLQRG